MKDIKGYENLYAITSCGRIWSYISKKFLKPRADKDGYLLINLHKDNKSKTYKVHRLVAEAYICNDEELPQINHRDENKTNNCIGNLEWCTHIYNQNYGTHNEKISQSRRKAVFCVELGRAFKSIKTASRELNINDTCISLACKNKIKTSGGYHWKYFEGALA